MFFLCQIFLTKCKNEEKNDTVTKIDGLFFPSPFEISIYFYLIHSFL